MTAIKVCGIKNRETFEHVQALPVEYVGFVFAPSKRQVTAEQVAELTRGYVGTGTRKLVGVFVNHSIEEIGRIAEIAGLHVLQLHGDETPEVCQQLRERTGLAVWKAWGVRHDERDAELATYHGKVDAVLLDNERGGTGERFRWESIPHLREVLPDVPLFVAGGLNADNVGALLETYAVDGVDVSSGVETDGTKDPEKISCFVTRVREKQ